MTERKPCVSSISVSMPNQSSQCSLPKLKSFPSDIRTVISIKLNSPPAHRRQASSNFHAQCMLLRHSPLRLILVSNFLRPVSHPRISFPAILPLKSASPASSFLSTTTATMFRMNSDPWNELHDGMQLYHNHFRHTFNQIYSRSEQVSSGAEDADDLDDLLSYAYGLYRHLDAHHSIEE